MQDRFKFRGYNKNLKQWFYGAYITQAEYADSPFEQPGTKPAPVNHFIVFEEMVDWGLPTKLKLSLVDKDSIGQCTGLKDRSGKLIYEGDIIEWKKENHIVVFDERNATFGIKISDVETYLFNDIHTPTRWIEVIGNIYENKQLLEEQK